MVAPAYTDIAHFRAPFKNWPYLGMGPSTFHGFGVTDVTAGQPGSPQSSPDAFLDTDKDGVRVFKPKVADVVMSMLATQGVILLGDDNSVQLSDLIPQRENANAWVKRKLAEGKTVIAGSSAGAHLFSIPIPGVTKYLQAVKGTEAEKAATAGLLPLGAVLARPSGFAAAGLFGPIGIAALALLAVGGIVYFAGKKHRRSRA